MSATLPPYVLQDELAVLLARVMAVANKQARESGIEVDQSVITISQISNGEQRWRVNYGPSDYVGRRGGDLIVEVDAGDVSVKRVLRGQ